MSAMPFENPPGTPRVNDPRIEKAVEFIGSYQQNLRDLFSALPDESKAALSRVQNPHLATGPTTAIVCSNGVVAAIKNGLESPALTVEVKIPEPTLTMVDYFNSTAEWVFNFIDPISKLTSKGSTARFQDASAFEGNVVAVIVVDRPDRLWLPPASKLFLIGWKFLENVDLHVEAQETAKQSLEQAYGVVNLRSPGEARKLLEEYRRLLDTAADEDEFHQFLKAHPEFVYPEYDQAISKPSLGGERQPDFAFSIRSASGSRWVFVEIERPDKPIFTKAATFQFSHQFTQSKGQLLQWDSLITQGHSYFTKRFPGLLKPEFHLIYGRDAELDPSRREMLAAEFSSTSNRMFSTFDDLANRFERILSRVFPGP